MEIKLFETQMFPQAVPMPVGGTPRRDPRQPCYLLADVGVAGHHRIGIVYDMSPGGAFVCLDLGDEAPPLGSAVDLVMLDSGQPPLRAHVAHVIETGLGVQFDQRLSALPAIVGKLAE
ncbi:MAG TPA: PilZ domain-containing protein [Myxococcales bacterium]|nr:PilZ domain-containing protein [Myxococcales bacterium]